MNGPSLQTAAQARHRMMSSLAEWMPDGVKVMLLPGQNHVTVGSVFVPETLRGQGLFRRVMKDVLAEADRSGVPLGLEVDIGQSYPDLDDPDVVMPEAEDAPNYWLVAYYRGMGFEETGEWGDHGPLMSRSPTPRPALDGAGPVPR